jgi:hypothetical protein
MKQAHINHFISVGIILGLFFIAQNTKAFGDRPMGGKVISTPSLEILEAEAACYAMQMTTVYLTITSTWTAETDTGSSQTFTYFPNLSPKPAPSTWYLEQSTRSKTKYDAQANRWLLGMYETEFKKIGSCKVTTTIVYPPASTSVDIPSYLNLSKFIMYGASS